MVLDASGNWEVVGDKDWFSVQLVAGQSYRIEITGPDGEVVRVLDPNGNEFGFFNGLATSSTGEPQPGDEDSDPGHFTPLTSGTYYFSANGEAVGNYNIKISPVEDDFADNVNSTGGFFNSVAGGQVDAVAYGRLEEASDVDFFSKDLSAFTQYDFSLNLPEGYQVIITNANGVPVHFGGPVGTFVPTVAGRYSFAVVAPEEDDGFVPQDYTLSLTARATTDDFANHTGTKGVITLTPDEDGLASGSTNAQWNYVTDSDWFRVDLVANKTYSIGIDGLVDPVEGTFQVRDANGNIVSNISATTGFGQEGGNNSFAFTPTASGTYFVKADAVGSPGAYTATVQQVADDFTDNVSTAGRVTVNRQADGVIQANGDTDWFAVTLTAGQSYTVTSNFDPSDDYFGTAFVVGPDGSGLGVLPGNTFSAAVTGTYYIAASGMAFAPNPVDLGYSVGISTYNDDFTDNSLRAGSLKVGTPASGQTEVLGDVDWFAVTLTAGQRYVFSSSEVSGQLRLHEANGSEIGDVRSFTPTVTGTYYLSHAGGRPGAYTVNAKVVADDFVDNVNTTGKFTGSAGPGPITGTEGGDTLNGGSGDDVIDGRGGDDTLSGAGGNDTLTGGAGRDDLRGGDGNDTASGGADNDRIGGQAGDDKIEGDGGDDSLFGDAGNDRIGGGDGNDYISGGLGNDGVFGGAGNDFVAGGDGDDYVDGGIGADQVHGGAGNDRVLGKDGDDYVDGGLGNDALFGDGGNDRFRGGAGDDYLAGGIGNDVLYGDADNDFLTGGDGDDYLDGSVGVDQLHGGVGADVLIAGAGADYADGGLGNDNVAGGEGADTLRGGAGNDIVNGGAGADILFGEDGADSFRYLATTDSVAGAFDMIEGFAHLVDEIDLSRIDANSLTAGNQGFTLIGDDAFTGKGAASAGQLRVFEVQGVAGNIWQVEGDTNGDGAADFFLQVDMVDTSPLTISDFIM